MLISKVALTPFGRRTGRTFGRRTGRTSGRRTGRMSGRWTGRTFGPGGPGGRIEKNTRGAEKQIPVDAPDLIF